MKPGDLVTWKKDGEDRSQTLIFVKFTHWGGLYGQFIFPDGKISELGMWGVQKI